MTAAATHLCRAAAILANVLVMPVAAEIPHDFEARAIVAIADGDFGAESYHSGALPPVSGGARDALVLFRREAGGWQRQLMSGVSNSVVAPPEVLAVSPDGRFAYAAETLGPRPEGGTHRRDLPPGHRRGPLGRRTPRRWDY